MKEKITLTLSSEIKEYLVTQSEVFGMSASAYVTMIVNQYKTQTQALSEMSKIQGVLDQLKELAKQKS